MFANQQSVKAKPRAKTGFAERLALAERVRGVVRRKQKRNAPLRRGGPAELKGEFMSHEFDFNDGLMQCEKCGVVVPVEDAQAVVRRDYRVNVDYAGQYESSQRQLMVCERCHQTIRRGQRFRELRYRLVMILIVVLAVGVAAVTVDMLLRAIGVF